MLGNSEEQLEIEEVSARKCPEKARNRKFVMLGKELAMPESE